MVEQNEKICQSCGRPFFNRKKWEGKFHEIKYCSKSCSSKKSPTLAKEMILNYLEIKKTGAVIELKEISEQNDVQNHEITRCAARLLASENKISILQKNKKCSQHSFKGPIQVKRK